MSNRITKRKLVCEVSREVWTQFQLWAAVTHPGKLPGQAMQAMVEEKAAEGSALRKRIPKK